MRRLLLAASLLSTPALAQTAPADPSAAAAPPGAAQPAAPGGAGTPAPGAAAGTPGQVGAEQVVGLFMATCLQFGPNRDQLRGWLQQQGARQLPPAPSAVFLQKRPGAVYDASYQQTRLALVSLDNGACEAVAEFADRPALLADLAQAFTAGGIASTSNGADQADPKNPAVQRRVFTIPPNTDAGRPATVIVATASRGTPQAVLTLLPR